VRAGLAYCMKAALKVKKKLRDQSNYRDKSIMNDPEKE
jgi:hypothetical protein